jgi:trehalose 6-phosphate synthase
VRQRCPEALLAHFVHIPWAQSDVWTVLPEEQRRAVHDGLLANDVVGFHTARWARNFVATAADVLGTEPDDGGVAHAGRTTLVAHHAISIDTAEFEELAESPAVVEAEQALVARRPEHLVLRVDRTDPSKNIVRGFVAFGVLLEQHPELHGRVGFVARLDPSRQDVQEYADYLGAIEAVVESVNTRFATEEWTPIELQVADDFPASVAAYKQYDVLLVNAVFDGMNLVAKEAPLVNTRAGVLVLSENAGAHEELGTWALTVNPFDVQGQADALYAALTMGEDERRRRADALRSHVRAHDVGAWTEALLGDLDGVSRTGSAAG